jgi:hypothetical protein
MWSDQSTTSDVQMCSFIVNTMSTLKMTVFWDFAPCSLVKFDRRFGAIALMIETVYTSETSVKFYQTSRRNIPEDSHLHTRRRENLKSHIFRFICGE